MAQELFLKKSYDRSVDIFALGTLLYEMYTGEIPYYGLDPADIKDKILKDSNLPSKGSITKEVLELVNSCRSNNPAQRPQALKLLNSNAWWQSLIFLYNRKSKWCLYLTVYVKQESMEYDANDE